jgi:hypothetical protein
VAPAGVREAELRVDGKEVAKVGAPFSVSWALEAGTHELVAVAGGKASEGVRVVVREP